jgi:FHS family L-fucose permease-like MFS transporter
MSTEKKSMFTMEDGRNLVVTFALVSSLFLLWGVCNGMIDVMDKHFQTELGLSKSQSAWVQFAHYLGYFLMALPAGWLAIKLGYKGGIIAGLLMVAAGGFWFIPATHINAMAKAGTVSETTAFIGYLAGVCAIAAGLTFLETIANPYTTVLGPKQYAATRINLAQSCNGIGWIFGPIIGGLFFYTTDAAGVSTGSQTLYIPYAVVGVVVLVLSGIFYFAYIPDIKTEDDYHLDDSTPGTSHSIWKHPHFALAVLAQFLYVAAQAGIFSFFINYMTEETPSIPSIARTARTKNWIEVKTRISKENIKDVSALANKLKQKADPVSAFVADNLSESTKKALADYKGSGPEDKQMRLALAQDLNEIVKKPASIYDQQRFSGVNLQPKTKELVSQEKPTETTAYVNRVLLQDAYSQELVYKEGFYCISDKGASMLASLGFVCFLIGRFTGAGILRKFSAHKVLGLYGLMNVVVCMLVFLKLGWFSVACVFLSYFFMSIMFPTIFALGIYGLGVRAKRAAAYIVMAIMGGAILPKLMGFVADQFDMSRGFIVPLACFAFVSFYGFNWPKFSGAESMTSVKTTGGH